MMKQALDTVQRLQLFLGSFTGKSKQINYLKILWLRRQRHYSSLGGKRQEGCPGLLLGPGRIFLEPREPSVTHTFPSPSNTKCSLAYLSEAKGEGVFPCHSGTPHHSPLQVNESSSHSCQALTQALVTPTLTQFPNTKPIHLT